MELAAAVYRIVEAPSPVYTEKSDHWQEYPDADTGRSLDLERIEIPYIGPAVTSFKENECEYRGLWLQYDRITQFDCELVIHISGIGISLSAVLGQRIRSQRVVFISSQGDDFLTVSIVSRHTVTADEEAFKRRISPISVVISEIPELRPGHQDQISDELRIG